MLQREVIRSISGTGWDRDGIAGPHSSDVASVRPKLEIPSELAPVAGMRIAFSADLGCYQVDPDVAANSREAADRLREAGAVVEEVALPWDLEVIKRASRIHFGMIFGPSIREIYAKHADELTSYAQSFMAESDQISKDDFVAGLALEGEIYAPLGYLLEEFDTLICDPGLPFYCASGINGQHVFIHVPTQTVVVKLSTWSTALSANWLEMTVTGVIAAATALEEGRC